MESLLAQFNFRLMFLYCDFWDGVQTDYPDAGACIHNCRRFYPHDKYKHKYKCKYMYKGYITKETIV